MQQLACYCLCESGDDGWRTLRREENFLLQGMMMRVPYLICAVVLTLGFDVAESHASEQPTAGIYLETTYLQAVTPSGGAVCEKAGDSWISYFTYPGPLKSGATRRAALVAGQGVRIWAFPTTPALAASSWSGSLSQIVIPSGIAGTGTFSFALTYVDKEFLDRIGERGCHRPDRGRDMQHVFGHGIGSYRKITFAGT